MQRLFCKSAKYVDRALTRSDVALTVHADWIADVDKSNRSGSSDLNLMAQITPYPFDLNDLI